MCRTEGSKDSISIWTARDADTTHRFGHSNQICYLQHLPLFVYSIPSVHLSLWAFSYAPLCYVPPQVEVWTLGHCNTLSLFFLSQMLQICCCALDNCPIAWTISGKPSDVLTLDWRILWYIEEFLIDSVSARLSGPTVCSCGYKRSPNHHPSTAMLYSLYDFFFLCLCCAVFSFSPNVLCILANFLFLYKCSHFA